MSKTRKLFISTAALCLLVIIEGLYSAARHFSAHDEGAGLVALVRAALAWWLGSAITAALKSNPKG